MMSKLWIRSLTTGCVICLVGAALAFFSLQISPVRIKVSDPDRLVAGEILTAEQMASRTRQAEIELKAEMERPKGGGEVLHSLIIRYVLIEAVVMIVGQLIFGSLWIGDRWRLSIIPLTSLALMMFLLCR